MEHRPQIFSVLALGILCLSIFFVSYKVLRGDVFSTSATETVYEMTEIDAPAAQILSYSIPREVEERRRAYLEAFKKAQQDKLLRSKDVDILADDQVQLLWKKNAVPFTPSEGKSQIIVIIDDMGVNKRYSSEVIDIKVPLTLAFLPYASGLAKMTKQARDNGHELLIHMPMEAMDTKMDLGGIELRTTQNSEEFHENLQKALQSFEGYIGLNNHMGSRLTQDEKSMDMLMRVLKANGMAFVDSRTIHTTVGYQTALKYDVPTIERDVFLDHETGEQFVRKSLERAENIAAEHGYAVVIGHPKKDTVKVLREWIDSLEDKPFEIAPLSAQLQSQQMQLSHIAQ